MKADVMHVGLAAPYREGPAAPEPCSFPFRLGSAALCSRWYQYRAGRGCEFGHCHQLMDWMSLRRPSVTQGGAGWHVVLSGGLCPFLGIGG